MSIKCILILYMCIKLCYGAANVKIYDTYSATVATKEQLALYASKNTTGMCTTKIKPCDKNEWSRMDGTCNNLKYPSRSARYNPMYRILPADYFQGKKPRKARSGKDLSSPRKVRLTLLKTGISVHPDLTLNFPGYTEFMFSDINSLHDVAAYLSDYDYCCEPEHINDDICAPNFLEDDDPVHRFDDIRCLNLTRPFVYQDYFCTNDSVPSPVTMSTQAYDLSHIYNKDGQGERVMRTYSGGLLIVQTINGKIWPQTGPKDVCFQNADNENVCFKYHVNGLLSAQLLYIWYVRHHNYIARQLAAVNPCWDDEILFQVARNINIAFSQQLYFYELLPSMIDFDHLVKTGILSNHPGFRDIYDEDMYPTVSVEFMYTLRWFHIIQKSRIKTYDTEGHCLGEFPLVNNTFRTGLLAKGNNMEKFTQVVFREPTADFDHSVDYDIADVGLGSTQRAFDIVTSDLAKGRLLGLPPYVKYLHYFMGINITCCEDLVKYKIMCPERVRQVKLVYEDCRDLDLMAGMWLENKMKHSKVALTVGHIFEHHLRVAIMSDRFWFERPNRPHAFTKAQLLEIRKSTLSSLMCTVGDKVSVIQPNAFKTISPKNPLTPCKNIPRIDFSKWADPKCSRD